MEREWSGDRLPFPRTWSGTQFHFLRCGTAGGFHEDILERHRRQPRAWSFRYLPRPIQRGWNRDDPFLVEQQTRWLRRKIGAPVSDCSCNFFPARNAGEYMASSRTPESKSLFDKTC